MIENGMLAGAQAQYERERFGADYVADEIDFDDDTDTEEVAE